jgi:hypothetical protein
MIIAASTDGWHAVAAVVVMYELATIATMVVLVSLAYAGAGTLKAQWLDRYGDVAAGAFIIVVGATVAVLGI